MALSRGGRHVVLLGAVLAAVVGAFARAPLAQWPEYHDFADTRTILGLPNALDVVSNLPFAIAGVLGLVAMFTRRAREAAAPAWERLPWATLFLGVALTAPGSAWYHLAPDNARLVWDRLPMTVAFMGLLSVVLAERVSLTAARRLFPALVLLGIASVLYWDWTEQAGSGDLRLYGLVQFGSLLVVLLSVLLYPARAPGGSWLWAAMAFYALAKLLEATDARVYALGQVFSGHTLKHLAAGAGGACLLMMYVVRRSSGALVFPDRDA